MTTMTNGIHHITAFAGDPQANLDFVSGVLGLRLVKKTVNFDDPYTYHLYFGNGTGEPGTLATFFPWTATGPRGRKGTGQVSAFSYSIVPASVGYWTDRIRKSGFSVGTPVRRFDDEVLSFQDHDGFTIELIASAAEQRPEWDSVSVPPQHSIRGLHSVTLRESDAGLTGSFLSAAFECRSAGESGNRLRFDMGTAGPGSIVDLLDEPESHGGVMGVGVIHHVAFRTPSAATQQSFMARLDTLGYGTTPVMDRSYFTSVYFHEPGGVLCELATDPPGFLTDERPETLGTSLQLPPWIEPRRKAIAGMLPPLITARTLRSAPVRAIAS
jgi:glyoxalase family protein